VIPTNEELMIPAALAAIGMTALERSPPGIEKRAGGT